MMRGKDKAPAFKKLVFSGTQRYQLHSCVTQVRAMRVNQSKSKRKLTGKSWKASPCKIYMVTEDDLALGGGHTKQ